METNQVKSGKSWEGIKLSACIYLGVGWQVPKEITAKQKKSNNNKTNYSVSLEGTLETLPFHFFDMRWSDILCYMLLQWWNYLITAPKTIGPSEHRQVCMYMCQGVCVKVRGQPWTSVLTFHLFWGTIFCYFFMCMPANLTCGLLGNLVSSSHVSVKTLGLQTCPTAPDFIWVLDIWIQLLMFTHFTLSQNSQA